MSWFEPLPIAEYVAQNKQTGENPPSSNPSTLIVPGISVRCGPTIRLWGTHESGHNNYRASLMLVVDENDAIPEVTYAVGPLYGEVEPELSQGQFPGVEFHAEQGVRFYRYKINLELLPFEQKVKYAINGHSIAAFSFYVPLASQLMNVMLYSCNGLSLGTDPKEFKLSLWLDVIKKHEANHYHVMLGGGDQLYCDGLKLAAPKVKEWAQSLLYSHKLKEDVDAETLAQIEKYYIDNYLGWFGHGYMKVVNGTLLSAELPLALLMIPQVNIYDDHDIIDGFGSYKDRTMRAPMFVTIGNVAYKYYMLFQQHVHPDEPLATEDEPLWIIGKEGPFIHQKNHSVYMNLGKEIALLGLDCRTERRLYEIVSRETYKKVFDRLDREISNNPNVKHLLLMLGVPIFYPRLVFMEKLLSLKLLLPARKLAQLNLINKGLVNEFDGQVEVLDDLNDHWCAKDHKAERNWLVKQLIQFGASKGVRITILSGDVHLAALGRVKLKFHKHPTAHLLQGAENINKANEHVTKVPEHDPRLMFNVISLAIINGPPPDGMATLLQKRLHIHRFDKNTDEDCVPLFFCNVNGKDRDNNKFLNKRNWLDLILAKQDEVWATKALEHDPERRYPQPVLPGYEDQVAKALEKMPVNEVWVKYPVLPDSLVTRIRVEQDANDYNADTTAYEVMIPPLLGHYKLEQAPVKHVDTA